MQVGNRLRQIREELGYTQKSMAEILGLGETTWQGYELRNHIPKGETLATLVEMGFDANWILTGIGDSHVAPNSPAGENPRPADGRTIAGNVAFFLAQAGHTKTRSPHAFTELFLELYDYLLAAEDTLPSGDAMNAVIEFAAFQKRREGGRGGQ